MLEIHLLAKADLSSSPPATFMVDLRLLFPCRF